MPNYRVTLACRNYDRTQPLIRGLVKADGIDLAALEMESVPRMFAGLYRGEYDASEMSLAELVYYTSRGQNDFVGIPVFPSRVFRHSFIFYNTASGIRRPEDLSGKKIGFPRLIQTACVWIRGILVEEYGVSPKDTTWYVASIHHWDDGHGKDEVIPRDGSTFHRLERGGRDENEYIETALGEGRLDALGSTQSPAPMLKGDTRIRRLFENSQEVEADYYKRTRIFPIMHVLALRKPVLEAHPELPEKLFQLFCEAKKRAQEWLTMDASLNIVWKNHWMQREEEIFRADPWAYGLEKNSHVIEKFLSYCHALGIAEKPLTPKDLFVPSTWDLIER